MPHELRAFPKPTREKRLAGRIPVFSLEDSKEASVSLLVFRGMSTSRYQLTTTEYLFVLRGFGVVRFIDRDVKLRPQCVLKIGPETPHQFLPKPGSTLQLLAFSVPAWYSADEKPVKNTQGQRRKIA